MFLNLLRVCKLLVSISTKQLAFNRPFKLFDIFFVSLNFGRRKACIENIFFNNL